MVQTLRTPAPALAARRSAAAGAPVRAAAPAVSRRALARSVLVLAGDRTVLIGLAADSGCGKARRGPRRWGCRAADRRARGLTIDGNTRASPAVVFSRWPDAGRTEHVHAQDDEPVRRQVRLPARPRHKPLSLTALARRCSAKPPPGGNPDSNSLISDTTTVLCLDDYHCHDRQGRKLAKVTALAPTAQNFGAWARRGGRRRAARAGPSAFRVCTPQPGLTRPPQSSCTRRRRR